MPKPSNKLGNKNTLQFLIKQFRTSFETNFVKMIFSSKPLSLIILIKFSLLGPLTPEITSFFGISQSCFFNSSIMFTRLIKFLCLCIEHTV